MEHHEPLKFGHDPDALSKRRISSILKAPKTFMRASGGDQDENQDETRTIEKRRNSRRVSFASTNNVLVFSKDIKTESPEQAPTQNLTGVGVSDGQQKKMMHFDASEDQPITGLDTMLSKPLLLSQLNKENFFPDPYLHDECVDRTMLLGEDTGYMDMTHSHTITIDKDAGINLSVLENVTGLHGSKCQNDMPSKTSGHMEKDTMHSEFHDFLASLSKPGTQNTVAPSQKRNLHPFGSEDKANMKMDKENVLPPRFTKQAGPCSVNPQPRGLQQRALTTSFLEQEHMDMTKSHTVVIDRREVVPHSVNRRGMSFSNDLTDMEITRSQTAIINFKVMEKEKGHMPPDVDHNKSNFISDDTSGMVMTQVFDGFLQEQEHRVSKDEAAASYPKAHTVSFFSQSESKQRSDQNVADHFQNNLSFANTPDCDDMEMTQSQTVLLETKCGGERFGISKNVSSFVLPSSRMYEGDRVEIAPKLTGPVTLGANVATASGERKKTMMHGEETLFPNDQSGFMELTCQASTSVMAMSPSPDDMELTGCNNVIIDSENTLKTKEIMSRKRTSFMIPTSASTEVKKVAYVQSDLSVPQTDDDMEMTQCQTVVLESKHCVEAKPFSMSRNRLSLMPVSRKSDVSSKKHMETAHDLTGHAVLNRCSYFDANRCAVPAAQTFLQQKQSEYMDVQEISMSVEPDDMDLTGCKTITIDTKSTSQAGATKIIPQKASVMFSSASAVLEEDEVEMREAVREKPGKVQPSQNAACNSQIAAIDVDAGDLVEESCFAGVDLVKGRAGTVEPSNCEVACLAGVKENSSLHGSENDCDMEMTGAFTMPLEEQCFGFKQADITKEIETLSGATDHETFTEVQEPSLTISQPTVTSAVRFPNEDGLIVKKDQSKSRRRSLADLHEKLRNIAQCINEPDGLLTGSSTAPITSICGKSLVDECSERPSSAEPLKETALVENNFSSANVEGTTTPFNLKNFLTTRLSVRGVTPKLPSRTKSASPNRTEPIGANRFQSMYHQINLEGNIQNSGCAISMIDNEVFPEEDLSDSVFSYLGNKKDEQDAPESVAPLGEVETRDNMNVSQSEKKPYEVEVAGGQERNEAGENLWHSKSAALGVQNASSLMTKVIDDTCSSSSSTNIKCDGISESTLRSSQFDSQIDGTVDYEFDFNKVLQDGSITVNDFLSHFSANSVIHKSRPSAVPDHLRVAETHTMEDLLREKYIYRAKQRVYEADCQKLTKMVEGFKTQMAAQDKPLIEINGTLLQDLCAFSNIQLQKFGAKLKERRIYFRKSSKALSHEMKTVLYTELLKTTQESKQSLMTKITEANEMLKELDVCVNDLESELTSVNRILMEDDLSLTGAEPALKAKRLDLDALNSKVAETKIQICDVEHQKVSLEDSLRKRKDETRELESRITTLNSLNEWRFHKRDENGVVFTFLHNTVHLDIKLQNPTGKEWLNEDVEHGVEISFEFLLDDEHSQPHASMIHKLLAEHIQDQTKWIPNYPTTRHIPVLLHDVSLVVSRLRLLGEEIHRLKKWGGLRLGLLNITCVDTIVEMTFSSLKAFAKFELSLAVTPDYPSSPLQIHKFQNYIGDTRVDQIETILSSVIPAKNQLTNVVKRIHDLMK